MNQQRRTTILLRERGKMIYAILGYVQEIPAIKRKLRKIDDRLASVEGDVASIKLAVTDHSGALRQHEQRLTKLEG